MLKNIIYNKSRLSLLLISLTYLSLWILGFMSFFISPLIRHSFISPEAPRYIYLSIFYITSLFLPAAGLVFFIENIRSGSSIWYLGIPLFVSIFLITFQRDNMYMSSLYSVSFIPAYDSLHVLGSKTVMVFVSILFSLSSVMFTLSVPEEKRLLMKVPLIISIVMTASISIYFLVDTLSKTYISENQLFGFLHILTVLFFGLSLVWVAVKYEN
ncbi:MAG: hypothetical protein PWQ63_1454, partial [Methanolobus sp.]|nr:hypothetical protein [Methanolobus sp.]